MAVSRATKTTAAASSTSQNSGIPGAPRRVSFAKIREPLEVPNLLDLQIQSFEWLIGHDSWFQRRIDAGDEEPLSGLAEVLRELSPTEDLSGQISLSFSAPGHLAAKSSAAECKDEDMTYAAPPFVTPE